MAMIALFGAKTSLAIALAIFLIGILFGVIRGRIFLMPFWVDRKTNPATFYIVLGILSIAACVSVYLLLDMPFAAGRIDYIE